MGHGNDKSCADKGCEGVCKYRHLPHFIRTRIPGKSFRNHKRLTVIIVRRSPFKSLYLAVRVEWGKLVEKLNERDEEGKGEISGEGRKEEDRGMAKM